MNPDFWRIWFTFFSLTHSNFIVAQCMYPISDSSPLLTFDFRVLRVVRTCLFLFCAVKQRFSFEISKGYMNSLWELYNSVVLISFQTIKMATWIICSQKYVATKCLNSTARPENIIKYLLQIRGVAIKKRDWCYHKRTTHTPRS